jgi:hypothetical protein
MISFSLLFVLVLCSVVGAFTGWCSGTWSVTYTCNDRRGLRHDNRYRRSEH